MPRQNLITAGSDAKSYICISCDQRPFSTEQSLLQHCRNSKVHQGQWCNRCKWLFASPTAQVQHRQQSSNHWLCDICSVDFGSKSELDEHRIKAHQQCADCHKEFDSKNSLIMHQQVHLPPSIECYGCYRQFASHSAVLIHLESGICTRAVTRDLIEEWAFQCYQSKHYTTKWEDNDRYRCPQCRTVFNCVSGLLQHVESPACSVEYDGSIWKLRNFISKKVSSYDSSATSNSS